MLLTVLAFVLALGVLIAVHEYGHYRVAVACGVKVLRFSVGFGQPLLRWQRPGSPTEFVIGAFPLGGYVRMLDEREGDVPQAERHLAFNTQPLRARAAIVAAGPLANLLLAVVLYAAVNWLGVQEPQPVLAQPLAGSLAEQAGLRGGDWVHEAAVGEEGSFAPVRSFEDLRWTLAKGALDGHPVRLRVQAHDPNRPATANGTTNGAETDTDSGLHRAHSNLRELLLPLHKLQGSDATPALFERIGVLSPWTQPVLGDIMDGSPAQRAGLRTGDLVLRLGEQPVHDGQQLRSLIRASLRDGQPLAQVWQVQRPMASGAEPAFQTLTLTVTPDVQHEQGQAIGRIGAYVGGPVAMTQVRYGPLQGVLKGAERTWEMASLTLRMMGRMVIGQASVKNLSGPLTIADYAGRSASMGLTQYLAFLALISVSLGVLNLLPLPVLDGGHLMYYLWEGVTGRGISDAWMQRLQRAGVALLLVMMSIALFNDVTRLLG